MLMYNRHGSANVIVYGPQVIVYMREKTTEDPRGIKQPRQKPGTHHKAVVTLKAVGELVGVTASTVSAVLNNSSAARSVPEHTKKRILDAARALDYRPNFFARSLRAKRTYMVGVILQEIGDAYGSVVVSGIERYLREENVFFLTVAHRHDKQLLESYSTVLRERGAEGFITVDTVLTEHPRLPTIAVAGHQKMKGVTNVVLDHRHAATLALTHLLELGHTNIAFMKGSPLSADSHDRWIAICEVAAKLGIRMWPELVIELQGDDPTPNLGYPFAKELLQRQRPFTALFAYNDISAIGSICAFQESGVRVPEDVSVVGFDDIQTAAYMVPPLTTVKQPLLQMGQTAARTLLKEIEGRTDYVPEIVIKPELIVRKSTARLPSSQKGKG